ncbi:MAG: hypothetical protein A2V93_03435 [Ignavibacteria bacterium RBG_16_34_14]|nr:MAG: hypothetical protein A2V93_03435 [Ignavibacteria bacterium RBG_16_34_14]
MQNFLKIILFVLVNLSLNFAQELFIPRDILSAYEKGTRSFDGTPGKNYWQNSADYKIKVSVNPAARLVKGSEKIIYYNNSPDTLKEIIFNIIQDLNKYESERSFTISKESLSEGVQIGKFLLNNSPVLLENSENVRRRNTLLILKITDNPFPPKSTMNFEIEWNFIIPKGRNPRMGTYDSTSFLIAYWFPQIAVYDDIDGWDMLYHTGEQEFYNDFSNYEVEITVPNTFGVWATGILQNPEEVLTPEYLNKYKNAWTSDKIINIVKKEEVRSGKIYKFDSEFNTWKYKAEYIPDFTFSTSDHYLWDAVSLVVDETTDQRVYLAAVYKEESKDFYEVAEILRKTINYFSNELPGIPFPYPCLTIFNGSGGMEFPMIINNGSAERRSGTVGVTSHEAAHEYFPFYMGINEEKYGWMDEGMATFLPFDFQEKEGEYNPRLHNIRGYERYAGTEMELPMMIPNYQMKGSSQRMAIYVRPALAYDFLRDALGKELFAECMHEYIKRWNGKHPIPYDFFFTFNEVSEKDLNWYWKPWFFERGYPDLSIIGASFENGILEVTIEKVGIIPTPVELSVTLEDSSIVEIYETAMIWERNQNTVIIKKELGVKPLSVTLGSDMIPDSDTENNYFNFSTSTH